MEANKLYQYLEKDFIKSEMKDDWAQKMECINDFLSENFKERSMGLVCDFTTKIERVYTAVFPSKKVLNKILDDRAKDAMLFVHHPSVWDIRNAPEIFYQMDRKLLQQFKKQRISIYNLHVPLDNYGKYSTSVSLAKALEINIIKPFAPYFGALAGVFGKTHLKTAIELKKEFENIVGHRVGFYNYGENKIKNGRVAVVAGGGNEVDILEEVYKEGVNLFIVGISAKNDYSNKSHDFAKNHKINILGGTHYSTEKFACLAMTTYFQKKGLSAEFIEDIPLMEDI